MREKRRRKRRKGSQREDGKTTSKMIGLNLIMALITLNAEALHISIKRQRLFKKISKTLNFLLLKKCTLNTRCKYVMWDYAETSQKKAKMAILLSDKVSFKAENIARDLKKGQNAPKQQSFKINEAKLIDLQREIHISALCSEVQ